MKEDKLIVEFKTPVDSLSGREYEVLKLLIEACKLMAKVYQAQLAGNLKPQFYPKDATRAEIEKAAQKNPQILSPYTIVERDKEGKLIAIPYHLKYHDLLLPVSKKLKEAAALSTDKKFARFLEIHTKVLLNGEYGQIKQQVATVGDYLINLIVGPVERIEDDLFFIKRSYQALIGIENKALTKRADDFKKVIFSSRRRFFAPDEKVDFLDKAKIRVDNTLMFAGMIAKFKFTGETLPNDIEIIEKYGTTATIFLPMVRQLFLQRHYPIYKSIFAPNFRQSFEEADLSRGYLYTVIVHEIARVLVRYRLAVKRLKEFYPIFNEMTLEALAIKLCGNLLIKDMISQKEMESILVMFLTRIFDYYLEMKDNPTAKIYVLGNAILLNSLIDQGALRIGTDGISWPNFTKMFISVSNVADEIGKVLAEGSYKDAQHYINKHSSLAAFKKFRLHFDK